MNISKKPTNVSIELSPSDYWLRENKGSPDFDGEYVLTHRIDMSYKGKDDQEGSVVLYMNKAQAEIFRDAGFSEVSGGVDPTIN